MLFAQVIRHDRVQSHFRRLRHERPRLQFSQDRRWQIRAATAGFLPDEYRRLRSVGVEARGEGRRGRGSRGRGRSHDGRVPSGATGAIVLLNELQRSPHGRRRGDGLRKLPMVMMMVMNGATGMSRREGRVAGLTPTDRSDRWTHGRSHWEGSLLLQGVRHVGEALEGVKGK